MIAKASASFSPWPKSSGAEPIPPKLPQPRTMLERSKSVPPSRRYSTGRAYSSNSKRIRVTIAAQANGAARVAGRRPVRLADQPLLAASGDRELRYLVTQEVGCRDMTQFYGVIAPGRAPDHSHVYDEVIYVLEGEGVLHGDGADKPVSAGSCIHLPPLFVHSLENSGDAPMRIVAVFHPAGDPASRAYEANE